MKLDQLVERYIAFKRTKGMDFRSSAVTLRCFSRMFRPLDIVDVTAADILAFLYRPNVVTSSWHNTYSTLNGFYRYAIAREYVKSSPLPTILPKKAEHARPYIYSIQNIRALLDCSEILNNRTHRRGEISVITFRTLLLLLYGTGLRLSEALSMIMADVDLPARLLIIRNTKFYKSRLVTCYRQGADVQRLLPQLSTYLGHVGITETQVYLKMTAELLREANLRFEHYAEVNHAG
jgi:integrase/recombinase XerD